MKFFIYNEVIFQLMLKVYNSEEHLVSILSHRHHSMKRNSLSQICEFINDYNVAWKYSNVLNNNC